MSTNAKTRREEMYGKMELRLVEKDGKFHGLVDRKQRVLEEDPDVAWGALLLEAGKAHPDYFGYDGARSRFLKIFPGGFQSEKFQLKERGYKISAKDKLDAEVPIEKALFEEGYGDAVFSVYNSTNLLSRFEKIKLKDF